jgi:hypothetical protein
MLCGAVDILKWVCDDDQLKHFSVDWLTRFRVGRPIASAFQEWLFPTGGYTMNALRASTHPLWAGKQAFMKHNWEVYREIVQELEGILKLYTFIVCNITR